MEGSIKPMQVIGTSLLDDVRLGQARKIEHVEPADRFEFQLVQIWQQILELPKLGVTDNFFELGGDSLLAARLLVQVEKLCGKKFSLKLMVEAPTVRQMARAIRDDGWRLASTSLVALSPHGSKPPLFLVPGGTGEAFSSMHLVSFVGDARPLYALRARELEGHLPPHPDVATMARDYVNEIRAVQPNGPYFLSGHCIGGNVALEMGQQLIEQGERVALMLVLDQIRLRIEPRAYYKHRLRLHLTQLRQLPPVAKVQYALNVVKMVIQGVFIRLRPPTYGWIVSANKPRGYQGKVTLLLSEKMHEYQKATLEESWCEIALGGLELYVIPGDHETFLTDYLSETTDRVRWCIENAEREIMPTAVSMQPAMALSEG